MNLSWSYSSYSASVKCLRYFKYCYIDKIVPVGPLSSDLIFGSALHYALNEELTTGDGLETFDIYWAGYKNKEVEYGRFRYEDLAKLGSEFIRKFRKLHASKYQLEFAEKRLYAEYKGIKFEGTPDFYGKYNGRTSLRDFKTSSTNYKPEKTDCALQLYLYAYLCTQNGLLLTESVLGYTVFNKGLGTIQDLSWDFNEKDMYKALDDLVEYCQDRESPNVEEKTYPRNLNACLNYNKRCEHWDLCHKEKE